MTQQRRNAVGATSCGRVYICGGYNNTALTAVECFDPESGMWEVLEPMAQRRSGSTIATTVL